MKSVLIVEDEEDYRKILDDQLVSPNYSVTFAKDGKEGLDLALKSHPDLIILDIIMPVMDGITMLNDLRKDEAYGSKVKVILLTNIEPDKEIMDQTVRTQHSYYIVKSEISMDELKKMIDDLLNSDEEMPSISQNLEAHDSEAKAA